MRKFAIYIDGVKTSLNGETGILLTSPTGLGAQYDTETVNLKHGFFAATDGENVPQTSIVGTVSFMGTSVKTQYEQYHDFSVALARGKLIEFAYTPYGSTEYRRAVKPAYITKTELEANWLNCPISFAALTPWYSVNNLTIPLTVSEGDTNLYTADILPDGDIPAAFVITANGGTPFTVGAVDSNNNVLGMFSINLSDVITQNGAFEFSTKYEDSHAIFTRSSAETDLVNLALLNGNGIDIFPRLPPGKTSHLLVGYSNGVTRPTSISATVYSYFRSV